MPEVHGSIQPGDSAKPLRLAIVSTPRSGNTWLRYILASLYDARQIASHSPHEVDWDSLPVGNCILQLHWHRTEDFVNTLQRYGFHVIVLMRHPLDVLVSILQFLPNEPQTKRWLDGEGGNENCIHGWAPASREFLQYATGPRARALLDVSAEWISDSAVLAVRYEDLVSRTDQTVARLVARIAVPGTEVSDAITQTTIGVLRTTSQNRHFWQGKPGLWRELVPMEAAIQIARAQSKAFLALGYECDPDPRLQPVDAENRWRELCS